VTVATAADVEAVTQLLGRAPEGEFTVVVRRSSGDIVVIENAPFLRNGRPMPTRYWLVDAQLRHAVSQLEAAGGVRRAEREVDPQAMAAAHERAARERSARLELAGPGPKPSGGIAGTRTGVKCLHAHLATYLADGEDPVGMWTATELGLRGVALSDLVVSCDQ
jgi:hypothetical protein